MGLSFGMGLFCDHGAASEPKDRIPPMAAENMAGMEKKTMGAKKI